MGRLHACLWKCTATICLPGTATRHRLTSNAPFSNYRRAPGRPRSYQERRTRQLIRCTPSPKTHKTRSLQRLDMVASDPHSALLDNLPQQQTCRLSPGFGRAGSPAGDGHAAQSSQRPALLNLTLRGLPDGQPLPALLASLLPPCLASPGL